MQIDVWDIKGKKSGTVTVPAAVFGVKEANPQLLAQAVRVYLSNQRQGTKMAKTRGDVAGSGKKIWRQKGTGNARHGDRYAPIFVGGGVAHGPKGNEQYKMKLPQKMRRVAVRLALTQKVQDKAVRVIDGLDKLQPKTKAMQQLLTSVAEYKPGKKVTLIVDKPDMAVRLAARNLEGVVLTQVKQLNTYQILNGGTLIFTHASLKQLTAKETK